MATADVGLIFTAINRTKAAFAQIRGDMDRLDKSTAKTRRGLRAIDAVFASIAAGSMVAWSKQILGVASNLEKARIRLAFFERSFKGADETFNSLREQFRGVPIATQTMLDGFTRLKAAGLDPVSGQLRTLSDAVLAFGGGTDEMNRAIIAIQQIAGKGVVSMEELRQQLGEAIPGALKIFADATGRTIPQFIEAVEAGKVPASELLKFFDELESRFGGFGQLMAQTIAGGATEIQKAFQNDIIKKVFGDFGLDTQIGIFLNEIASAISAIGESITAADVEKLTDFLENVVMFGLGAAQAIGRVLIGVIQLVNYITGTFGSLGADVLTSGAIGFFLFGKFGAVAGGLLPILDRLNVGVIGTIRGISSAVDTVMSIMGSAAIFGLIGFMLMGKGGGLLLATAAFIVDSILTLIRDLIRKVGSIPGLGFLEGFADRFGGEGTSVVSNMLSQLEGLVSGVGNTEGAFSGLATSLEGTVAAAFTKSRETWQDVRAEQERMIQATKELNVTLNDGAETLKQRNKALRDSLTLQIKAAEAEMKRAQIMNQIGDIRRQFGAQFFTSDAFDQARQEQQRFQEMALKTEIDILKVRKEMARDGVTAEQLEIFKQQIAALEQLKAVAGEAAETVTASGIQMRETWRGLGDIISDTAKTGLADLAKGTLEVEDLLRNMFNSITDLAADFLIELAKIKLLQAAAGMGGGPAAAGGGGTGFFGQAAGLVSSFAGALFGGGFARGGLFMGGTSLVPGMVNGPQLFAAGEKGAPEAIVPLTQLRTMMGNRVETQNHITIQAIDTQSAAQVLLSNREVMNQGLLGGQNLSIRTV